MNLLPIIILALILAGMIAFSRRNRSRATAADQQRRSNLAPGSEVMTTSGLYGTVVSVNRDDDSVLLSIAPGVEVKWTIAALRDVGELPTRYREAMPEASQPGQDSQGSQGSSDVNPGQGWSSPDEASPDR